MVPVHQLTTMAEMQVGLIPDPRCAVSHHLCVLRLLPAPAAGLGKDHFAKDLWPAQMGSVCIMDGMRHLHRLVGMLVSPQTHFNIENSADLEFFPAFLPDMHHHPVHGYAHPAVGLDCPARWLPFLRQCIGLAPLSLLQRLEFGSPHLAAPPNATARDVHLADLLQDRLGLCKRHQAAQPDRLADNALAPQTIHEFKLIAQGEKARFGSEHSSNNPAPAPAFPAGSLRPRPFGPYSASPRHTVDTAGFPPVASLLDPQSPSWSGAAQNGDEGPKLHPRSDSSWACSYARPNPR